jgi:hypothetical protein
MSFAVMSFINCVMGAQLYSIRRLIKVTDMLGDGAITQ